MVFLRTCWFLSPCTKKWAFVYETTFLHCSFVQYLYHFAFHLHRFYFIVLVKSCFFTGPPVFRPIAMRLLPTVEELMGGTFLLQTRIQCVAHFEGIFFLLSDQRHVDKLRTDAKVRSHKELTVERMIQFWKTSTSSMNVGQKLLDARSQMESHPHLPLRPPQPRDKHNLLSLKDPKSKSRACPQQKWNRLKSSLFRNTSHVKPAWYWLGRNMSLSWDGGKKARLRCKAAVLWEACCRSPLPGSRMQRSSKQTTSEQFICYKTQFCKMKRTVFFFI